MKEQTIEISFALGCGVDNVCDTKLHLESKFVNIETGNEYVLGSMDYLKLETNISNHGEKAYRTQLAVELPKSVYFRSISTSCMEQNSSLIICNVENPFHESKQKTLSFDLDMKEINSDKYVETLKFTLTVLTSSNNTNSNKFIKTLNIVREADIALTGKTSQQSYSYGNTTNRKPKFTQTYQIEKFGASPIHEVLLTVQIPTHIKGTELIKFLHLYTPKGYHADQPINCHSDVDYILEEQVEIPRQFDPNGTTDVTKTTDILFENEMTTKHPLMKVPVGAAELKLNKQAVNDGKSEFEFPSNRTFYINCTNSGTECSNVYCSIGPFKAKQNIAVLQIKMLFDVQTLSELLGTKDLIILSTDGFVTIRSPSNFTQNEDRLDFAVVSSVFIGERPELKIETRIIAVAVIAGLLLLHLLVMGLMNAGFFHRTTKMELKALKDTAGVEQFKQDSGHCAENKEDRKKDMHN